MIQPNCVQYIIHISSMDLQDVFFPNCKEVYRFNFCIRLQTNPTNKQSDHIHVICPDAFWATWIFLSVKTNWTERKTLPLPLSQQHNLRTNVPLSGLLSVCQSRFLLLLIWILSLLLCLYLHMHIWTRKKTELNPSYQLFRPQSYVLVSFSLVWAALYCVCITPLSENMLNIFLWMSLGDKIHTEDCRMQNCTSCHSSCQQI